MHLVDHGKTAAHPPTVAHILELLRSPVQTTTVELPLTQPSAQAISIHQIQLAGNGQRTHAHVYLPRMGLGAGAYSISTIKIEASLDVRNCLRHVNKW